MGKYSKKHFRRQKMKNSPEDEMLVGAFRPWESSNDLEEKKNSFSIQEKEQKDYPDCIERLNSETFYQKTMDLKITLVSSSDMQNISKGEIEKPETLNFEKTSQEKFIGETDGLFCEKIFGPLLWQCSQCKNYLDSPEVCDCGNDNFLYLNSQERYGHISLASPVVHPWFYHIISKTLDMEKDELVSVVQYAKYIVLNPGKTKYFCKQILPEEEYGKAMEQNKESFEVGMGAEAIQKLLEDKPDLKKMLLDVILVIPPRLRPLSYCSSNSSSVIGALNNHYRSLINRNSRLKTLLELSAPNVIIRNEKRLLQKAVDNLFSSEEKTSEVEEGLMQILPKSLSVLSNDIRLMLATP